MIKSTPPHSHLPVSNMHRLPRRASFGTLIAYIVLVCAKSVASQGRDGHLDRQFHSSGGDRTSSMILPLHHSHPNTPRHRAAFYDEIRRRQLLSSEKKKSQALMGLYDDLLSNGYYTTRLWIGTPAQRFALIVDTGSTVTYVPCSNCEKCGKHQDPKFQPELSNTYKPLKCNMDCSCDQERDQCTYERHYAEMSSSSGLLGDDVISFGNDSKLVPQRIVFGCENVETGDIYSQRADGIMGLGRGQLSIVDQLVEKGVINDSFSLCFGGMDIGGGAMVLGAFPRSDGMAFSHSDPYRSSFYNIDLLNIHVAGKPLNINSAVFGGKHGTILDSGTTYAYLPEVAFLAFKNAIMEATHSLTQIPGPDSNYNDICFSGAGWEISDLSKSFPDVDMVFGNGQKLSLSPENYLFRHKKVRGGYCLGIFQNGRDPTTLLGGIIVRNTLVTYDRENERIGFWKTNCSELHPSRQPSSQETPYNTSEDIPHGMSPSGSPHDVLPGTFRVGVITFDMAINAINSTMPPNFTELSMDIAHELDISPSQVHLINFTLLADHYLAKWAIYPAEPMDYISNTAALGIILSLREHRVRLPIGGYQLLEWNVKPQEKCRKWKGKHVIGVVVGVVVAVVLGLTALILVVWRRRRHQASNAYRRVDVPNTLTPEQELQPL